MARACRRMSSDNGPSRFAIHIAFAATERPSLHQCLSMVPRLRSMHLLPEKSYADYALEIRTLHPIRAWPGPSKAGDLFPPGTGYQNLHRIWKVPLSTGNTIEKAR